MVKIDPKILAVMSRWSLFGCGIKLRFDCTFKNKSAYSLHTFTVLAAANLVKFHNSGLMLFLLKLFQTNSFYCINKLNVQHYKYL